MSRLATALDSSGSELFPIDSHDANVLGRSELQVLSLAVVS
jgi:hypothetical protein